MLLSKVPILLLGVALNHVTADSNSSHPTVSNEDQAIYEQYIRQNTMVPVSISKRDDAFYNPAAGIYNSLGLGRYFAVRPITASLLYENLGVAFQIGFRSSGVNLEPQPAFTTVYIPKSQPSTPYLVSYQYAEDAVAFFCSPSIQFAAGNHDSVVGNALSAGYAVNLPDHEGIDSAFYAGIKQGHIAIDSIRAVINVAKKKEWSMKDSQIGSDKTGIALTGYSGGGFATGHLASQLHDYGADILQYIKVIVMGGLSVNIHASFLKNNGGPFAGFSASGLVGLGRAYPSLKETWSTRLTPEGRLKMDFVENACSTAVAAAFRNKDIKQWFTDGDAVFADSWVHTVNNIHPASYPFPVYILQATEDQITDINYVDTYVTELCLLGGRISYHREAGDHLAENKKYISSAISLIQGVFDNGATVPRCFTWQMAAAH